MKRKLITPILTVAAVTLLVYVLVLSCSLQSGPDHIADKILNKTGIKGGLIVHVGCRDGKLTAALCKNDSYLIHGLDTNPAAIDNARIFIKSRGLYGKVSADTFDGNRLPYIDNLVNLAVVDDQGQLSMDEINRVLCPNGVAYVMKDGTWEKTVKPRPEAIDEWTHYLHNPSNNAVSQDDVIAPLRGLQWVGSPRWARHHDHMGSMSALVSSGGRVFYIFDEGATSSILLQPKWKLIARDAFNGTILWKRPIQNWHPHLWPFKSGPGYLPRRLVADNNVVYVTLGLTAPLTAHDAATGETIRTYDNTDGAEEIIVSDGILYLVVNDNPRDFKDYKPTHEGVGKERDHVGDTYQWKKSIRHIRAIDAESGKLIWNADSPVVHITLAVNNDRVYFYDGESVVGLSRKDGSEQWRSAFIDHSDPMDRKRFIAPRYGPTLVVYEDVVLFTAGDRTMSGIDAATGEILWSSEYPHAGHYSAEDIFVTGGLAWCGATALPKDSGIFTGRDPRTGEVKVEFKPNVESYWFHQRCYRAKATKNYLLPSRTGIEFVDWRNESWQIHHWVRGGCVYGIMPCNGLIYAPMHDCACYTEAKLYGFNALTPTSSARYISDADSDEYRLKQGPAYGEPLVDVALHDDDWPTYRHDSARSGFTSASIPADLKQQWETSIGGRLTSPVIANGTVFLASVNEHTIYALNASNGKQLWSYTTGGRVDSPPTIYHGRVIFGSADGHVYCLKASDGNLVWRFRAAPVDMRLTSFEQVESVWPVHGSVLVRDGIVYTVAGRSMFLDGGLRFLRLDVEHGTKISESIMDDRDPNTDENLQSHVKILNMMVGLPDILSCDDSYIYMRSQCFDFEGTRTDIGSHSGHPAMQGSVQKGKGVHLFSPTGFIDDTWWHRSYWVWGRSFAGGWGGFYQAGKYAPGGRILAVDRERVYGYGRKPLYYRWRSPIEYHLFATDREPKLVQKQPERRDRNGNIPNNFNSYPEHYWSYDVPFHARAIIGTSDLLFIAGPPDVVNEEEAFKTVNDPVTKAKLNEQDAALEGQKGAVLWAVSKADGSKKMEQQLANLPVFDGMASAGGRLYMALENGNLVCFGK